MLTSFSASRVTTPDRDVQLADVFVHLADSLRTGHDVADTMDLLIQASITFTAATDAGILLADKSGVLHVVTSTNERTADVEEAQLGFDEGPCLDCYTTGQPLDVADLAKEGWKWPRFVTVADARGFRAAHASPLRLRDQIFGGMNLFSTVPGLFSDRDTAIALALAQVATISLVQHQTISNQATVNDQLKRALDSRVLIEQAKGVIAQRNSVPIDTAFTLLRTHARSTGSRLHDIADKVVNQQFAV
jgi:GAF domain-containing protein